MKNFWLMKSEPDVFSIDHLKKDKTTLWEGVRNYQARNFMMNDMKKGDEILFYHSSCEPPGIAGLAVVTKEKQPDPSQFDKKSKYFDSKATKEKPIWYCVEVGFEKKFEELVPLEKLKVTKELSDLLVLKRGQRLSIQPVTKTDFEWIKKNLVR
ncbi:MAG: EVE domain-containing protein [Bdellovibrio sp. 28-41-41]|nr:MAG: EVE domain-containing protein [Bdellovibrio sp. 28-41-41]